MTEEILDLDALLPLPQKVKINGKIIECNPLTIEQLVRVINLQESLQKIKDAREFMPLFREAMSPFVPALNDETFELTIFQARALITFAQKISIPQPDESSTSENKDMEDPKKKQVSVKE